MLFPTPTLFASGTNVTVTLEARQMEPDLLSLVAARERSMTDIFVFGSNLAGIHGVGAAKHAHEQWGAEWGVGEGLTGRAYALPTKDKNIKCVPFADVDAALCRFIAFARSRPDLRFLLTPVGTGYAGHSKSDVWIVLKREGLPTNVFLTSSWI